MEENYTNLSKDELIEKLKSKDKQITEITVKYDKWKYDFKNMFEKEKTEQREKYIELENNFKEYRNKTQDIRNLEFENNSLKDTIIAMAMYCFPSIAHIDINIIDIKENLRNISKGR